MIVGTAKCTYWPQELTQLLIKAVKSAELAIVQIDANMSCRYVTQHPPSLQVCTISRPQTSESVLCPTTYVLLHPDHEMTNSE